MAEPTGGRPSDAVLEGVTGLAAAVSRADTREAVARAVTAPPAALGGLRVGLYLRTETGLQAVRGSDWPPAEPAVKRVYQRGATTPLDADLFPLAGLRASPPDGGIAVPLETQGVLVAAADGSGGPPPATLVDLLATLTRLALERTESAASSRRGWEAYRRSRAVNRRLREVWDALRSVEARAMQARTAETVRRAVCEELAASGPFAFAWFGTLAEHSDALLPAERAGAARRYLDRVPLDAAASTPAVRAVVDRSAVLETGLPARESSDPWRAAARESGFGTVLAVPVVADGPVYGVFEVATRGSVRIGAAERRALERLGDLLAYVFDSLVLRQTFLGEATVELQLRVREADSPLATLSRALDAELSFESAAPEPDGSTRIVFEGALAPEAVRDVADSLPPTIDLRPVQGRGSFGLYEATVTGETLPGLLATHGAAVTSLDVDGSTLRATIAVADHVDVRQLVESVREVYPDTELLSRRTTTRPLRGGGDIHSLVEDRLTDRQFEVLQAAYYGGYFDWPRRESSVDLADTLDIAQPTFSRHLRAAERKLTALVFGD